jgi:hypothetical protein
MNVFFWITQNGLPTSKTGAMFNLNLPLFGLGPLSKGLLGTNFKAFDQ